MTSRVLVVDDELHLTDLLAMALKHEGFEVATAGTCQELVANMGRFRPDVVLLDVMLPDGDGIDACRRLRANGDAVPVIFLTARGDTEDKVRGLTVGGDDYITKPFSLSELVARVHAILRRSTGRGVADRHLVVGHLELDDDRRHVRADGTVIHLSPTEYKLLRYLMINRGRVLTRAQILDHVWQYDFGGDANILETYVSYLRRKLEPHGPSLIQTIRGVGYSLQA